MSIPGRIVVGSAGLLIWIALSVAISYVAPLWLMLVWMVPGLTLALALSTTLHANLRVRAAGLPRFGLLAVPLLVTSYALLAHPRALRPHIQPQWSAARLDAEACARGHHCTVLLAGVADREPGAKPGLYTLVGLSGDNLLVERASILRRVVLGGPSLSVEDLVPAGVTVRAGSPLRTKTVNVTLENVQIGALTSALCTAMQGAPDPFVLNGNGDWSVGDIRLSGSGTVADTTVGELNLPGRGLARVHVRGQKMALNCASLWDLRSVDPRLSFSRLTLKVTLPEEMPEPLWSLLD